jgi:hypothetical protein
MESAIDLAEDDSIQLSFGFMFLKFALIAGRRRARE